MASIVSQILFFLEVLIFASIILMHLAKKSSSVVNLYMTQSLIISGLLLSSVLRNFSWLLLAVVIANFIVKVVAAPYIFKRMIKKHHIKFSASTYLNGPLTLAILAVITAFTYSHLFRPLTIIAPANAQTILLAVAVMFSSVFMLINRKGALSQSIGVLSLENGIVSFAFLSGLEQMPALQLGILFDIAVWIIIAGAFVSMIYKHMETLDVSTMQHLKEE